MIGHRVLVLIVVLVLHRPNICGAMTGLICSFVFQAYYPFFNAIMYLQGAGVIALAAGAAYMVSEATYAIYLMEISYMECVCPGSHRIGGIYRFMFVHWCHGIPIVGSADSYPGSLHCSTAILYQVRLRSLADVFVQWSLY
jgi:hypothetical protein